tara:strand:- start:5198 stop:5764 length:567 start_codon:yes stop_codon:yes gene_type:complete
MRNEIKLSVQIPEGIACTFESHVLTCKKDSLELKRKIQFPGTQVSVSGSEVILNCPKGNKKDLKKIHSYIAHIKNIFHGLQDPFVYQLESANVHFPMTLKINGSILTITNFLGEKVPRTAKIVPGVQLDIKGSKITITSPDKEAAGQTAANLETATKVRGRDRRIFQDGIYITQKPVRISEEAKEASE